MFMNTNTKTSQVTVESINHNPDYVPSVCNLIISEGFTCGENLPGLGLVAVFEGQVIGYIGYSITYPNNAFIHMLVVSPAARKIGIGTRLINEAMRCLIYAGIKRIEATVDFESREAIRMYEKLGAKMRPVMLIEALTDEIEERTKPSS